jgi:hypothetical protein
LILKIVPKFLEAHPMLAFLGAMVVVVLLDLLYQIIVAKQ